MKRKTFVLIFLFPVLSLFAQTTVRIPTVGILPFESSGVGSFEAVEATRLVAAELRSWGFMTILEGDEAKNAEYLVKGQVSRQNNQTVLVPSIVSDCNIEDQTVHPHP